jgi:hypothetical protein
MVMMLLVVLTGVFMQVQQPIPIPAPPQPLRPMTPAEFGTLLYDGGGVAGTRLANGGFAAVDQVWSLPDFLASSRLPENTVDQPEAAQLNDELVRMVAGLTLIALMLVIGYQALSVLRGEVPNPMVGAGAISVVAIAGIVAANNRWFQHFPIDLVNLILQTISGAPIRQFVGPGFHVATIGDQLWAALVAIALVLVALALTVILFIEGAWCIVLGALLGLAAFGSVLPIFGGGCQFLLRRWIGSLFSPVIVFTALRLAAPSTAAIAGLGAPTMGMQLLMIAFLIVAWQAPGLMVGAISVSFPSVSQMYFAGRLFGQGRVSERAIPRGPGDAGSRGDPPRSRRAPPSPRGNAGLRPGRTGAGTAVTNRGLGLSPA